MTKPPRPTDEQIALTEANALNPFAVVIVDRTIRPLRAGADEHYGLVPGTNGTAAASNRACAEVANLAMGFRWCRANGKPASGLQYTPASGEVPHCDPWGEALG